MAPEARFLQIFECRILSLNFVQSDSGTLHSDSNAV